MQTDLGLICSYHCLLFCFLAGCTDRLDIKMETDLLDHSCHKAWVGQGGYPALVTLTDVNPPPGAVGSAVFTGFDPELGAAPHLSTFTLDGVFAGNWVFAITYRIWAYLDSSSDPDVTIPLVTLGDCASGASVYIWLVNSTVVAGFELSEGYQLTKHDVVGSPVSMGINKYHSY